mgnify:CR=1 FL=1
MEKISKHLSLAECIHSDTANKLGISNIPTLAIKNNIKLLAEEVFEPIRERFNEPIYVSSVYRCRQLNNALKGSVTSQHCLGEAMDIDMGDGNNPSNKDIFDYIKENLDFDQLIWEFGNKKNPSWVHVSYSRNGNRKQILKAVKVSNRTHYQIF